MIFYLCLLHIFQQYSSSFDNASLVLFPRGTYWHVVMTCLCLAGGKATGEVHRNPPLPNFVPIGMKGLKR